MSKESVDSSFHLSVCCWNGEEEEAFKKVIEDILIPTLKRNILLYVPHKHLREPMEDDEQSFHIFVWSAALSAFISESERRESYGKYGVQSRFSNGAMDTPSHMWHIPVDCRQESFAPSGRGFIIFDLAGHPVAEIVGANLFIFHDLCHAGTENERKILAFILKAALEFWQADHLSQRSQMTPEQVEQATESYFKLFEIDRETPPSQVRYLEEAEESLLDLEPEETYRDLRLVKDRLSRLVTSNPSTQEESWQLVFDRLWSFDEVLRIEVVANESIEFYLHSSFVRDPRYDTLQEIGRIRLQIRLGSPPSRERESRMLFFNYDFRRRVPGLSSAYNAPHVDGHGHPCFGTFKDKVYKLYDEQDLEGLFMLLLKFLTSVDVEDRSGECVHTWPRVKSREIIEACRPATKREVES